MHTTLIELFPLPNNGLELVLSKVHAGDLVFKPLRGIVDQLDLISYQVPATFKLLGRLFSRTDECFQVLALFLSIRC